MRRRANGTNRIMETENLWFWNCSANSCSFALSMFECANITTKKANSRVTKSA
jgi:hypothetical protein